MLRYGENPHQEGGRQCAAGESKGRAWSPPGNERKELSYNNLLDLDSALAIVRDFDDPAAVVIKHNNPCGAAEAGTLSDP